MRGIAMIFALAGIALGGCKDLGTDAPPEVSLPPAVTSGKFVVDEFSVLCEAKVNPQNDSVQARFPAVLRYHFEGSPGSVTRITFRFDKVLSVTLGISGWPDSADVIRSYTPSYWTTTQLAQRDSVLVECTVTGCYATFVDGSPQARTSWSWSTERTVEVRR